MILRGWTGERLNLLNGVLSTGQKLAITTNLLYASLYYHNTITSCTVPSPLTTIIATHNIHYSWLICCTLPYHLSHLLHALTLAFSLTHYTKPYIYTPPRLFQSPSPIPFTILTFLYSLTSSLVTHTASIATTPPLLSPLLVLLLLLLLLLHRG